MTARHQRATSDLFALLREKAPPKPACFRDQADWISWLHASESAVQFSVIKIVGRTGKGEANRGRKKTDEIRQDVDYCAECQWDHAELMRSVGKCHPPAWGTQPKQPSGPTKRPKGAKRPKLPAVAVVALNVETWQPKVYADIGDVRRTGFDLEAVLLAIRTGQAHKGHYWKLAEAFRSAPPALPKVAASLDVLASFVTETQMALPLDGQP